jgi:eukaryotic-like serine/threonine-protein kinase
MSAVASHAASGVQSTSSSTTFRAVIESRSAEGQRMSLDDAIAIIVPVCTDLKERHARGEHHWVHPSAIARGPDGLFRLNPALAVPPKDPKDRAALAPEVLKANTPGNARASVFAVGAMLYEAICGVPVGPGMRRPRDVEPSLPESFEHLLAKALVADPGHRPDDLGALASAMHHLAPMKSIPPPDVDPSRLDRGDDFEVDVKLSLMPPPVAEGGLPAPPPSGRAPQIVMPGGTPVIDARAPARPAAADPTRQLASLKARLESDPRPRYVVNKARMDHGPFNAVELLQQIASHKFLGTDILRDELTGASKAIDEWDEFAPFAQHARMHRDIAKEKKEVAKVESAEKTAGAFKFIIGGILAVALLGVGVAFVVKQVGSRKDSADLSDDPSAIDLSGGGSLKGKKIAGGGGGGRGGGGGFVGGMSYEQALNSNNQQITMGAKSGPDLTDAQLGAPLRSAGFISGCGAPDSMKVTVKVAVKMGRAVGVSVFTNPPNPSVAACVDRHVRGLSWPSNPKMDTLTTQY